MSELTVEDVKTVLDYDPDNGIFRWKKSRNPSLPCGAIAGTVQRKGYRQIQVNGRIYLESRLAWFYTHGQWPEQQIDHINGVRDDNRIENLRLATSRQNHQNRDLHRAGRLPGCHFDKRGKLKRRWMAQILIDKKRVFLGHYATEQEAHQAYVARLRAIGEELVGDVVIV